MPGANLMNRPLDILRALRPNQWTKNLVVLAAFCFAIGDQSQTIPLLSGYLCNSLSALFYFCLASSSIYIMNDIRDLQADRHHPTKQFRPLASGKVSIPLAAFISAILLIISLVGSFRLAPFFGIVVGGYVAMQAIYTFWLKHIALIDVFVIALGFVLRALGGGVAIHVTISPWLLICAFLLALFLALCKRRHEKILLEGSAEDHRASLENYDLKLLDQLIAIVSAVTIASYSIYTLSADTLHKFRTSLLSLTIPFVVFGMFRYLDLVYRKDAGGRPEKILLTDPILIVTLVLYGGCIVGVFLVARHSNPPL